MLHWDFNTSQQRKLLKEQRRARGKLPSLICAMNNFQALLYPNVFTLYTLMFTTVVYVALNSLFGHMVEQRKRGIVEPKLHKVVQQLNGPHWFCSHLFLLNHVSSYQFLL